VKLDPILVLHDPNRQLEQFEDDGHGLSLGKLRVAQGVFAQTVNQLVRSTGVKQTQMERLYFIA
jgi:hypothetical protein